jgi:hypothetical protein
MEERRRQEDKNWEEVKSFIVEFKGFMAESREYRSGDAVRQEYIKAQVTKTNGRVDMLEEKVQGYDVIIQDRKEAKASNLSLYMTIATVVMAVVTLVAVFKPK